MFLSSKKIGLLVSAFREVQNTQTVKHGEEIIKQLRKEEDYELGLTTFISVSKDCNQKMLAILQLKKILELKYEQSFWSLKTVYYEDVQKISINIRKIISYFKNIKWAGMFLKVDCERMGMLESVRYLELVFSLLKKPERISQTLNFHFQTLLQGLIMMIEVAQESEECLFMNLVCIATLFSAGLELDFHSFHPRLKYQWQNIQQKCKFCMNDSVCILLSIIQSMLRLEISNLETNNMEAVLIGIFKILTKSENLLTKYYAKMLSLMAKYLNIFAVVPTILIFVSNFNQYNDFKIANLLTQSQVNIEIDLNNFIEKQLESEEQNEMRQGLCYFIQEIFDKHYQSIAKQYCKAQHTTHPLFYFLLPLVNFYNSRNHLSIQQWISQNLQNVIDLLGKNITLLLGRNCNKQNIKDCIILIEFLIKYKSQIPIQLLIHVSNVMQDVSAANSSLSPFCYNFIEHIWEDITYLDYLQLTDFLLQHITKLNQNEWDHKLQYFSCFLHVSSCLEKQHQFYSNFVSTDPLLQQSIKSHAIVVSLLQQTPLNQIDHQLIILLIQLTSSLIKGAQTANFDQFHKTLNIDFLKKIVLSLKLYSEESADLIVFDFFLRNQLPISMRSLHYVDSNGLKDLQFKFQLLLKQIDYLKMPNYTVFTENMRFYDEIFLFLESLGQGEINQLKQSKCWAKFEEISTYCNYTRFISNNIQKPQA